MTETPNTNYILQLALSLAVGIYVVCYPVHNWDMLPYIGSAVAASNTDPAVIHDQAYQSIQGTTDFKELTTATDYRRDLYQNPYHLSESLPFYSIKPLFITAVVALHKLGLSWRYTGPVISGISCCLIGVIVASWLSNYAKGWKSTLLWLAALFGTWIVPSARFFVPDALACILTVLAIWLILEQRQHWWGMAVLVITIWTRPEYVILVSLMALMMHLRHHLGRAETIVLIVLGAGSYYSITHFSGNYGWFLLFQHTFLGLIPNPGEVVVHPATVLRSYPHVLILAPTVKLSRTIGLIANYALGISLLVRLKGQHRDVVAVMLLFGAIHILLFPNCEIRYFGPIFLAIFMSLVTLSGSSKLWYSAAARACS